MRFLITGGAGFLGVALANHLIKKGHTVRVLDDLSAGDNHRLDSSVHFTRGAIQDKPKVWQLLSKIDCVYHLAARVSVPESVLYPLEYNHTNVSGTVALMEALRDARDSARDEGVKRVILASSGAIYGEQKGISKVHERLLPIPTSPYAVSKLAAEGYVTSIGHKWNIEAVSLRIFNAYGPGQAIPPTHPPVIPQFMRQVLGGGSLVIHSNGQQVRDYVYVDDVVRALAAAAVAENVDQKVINIGTGNGHSIHQLIGEIEKVTERRAKTIVNPSVSPGVSSLIADITQAKELLDYEPQVSLPEGLKRLISDDPLFSQ